MIGTCYLHTVIDDHSRVAYVEAREDETKETATAVLHNAVAWFADRGVTVRRVISDNGSCYKSYLWRDTCADLGITPKKTRPYRPRPTARSNASTAPWPRAGPSRSSTLRISPTRALPAWVHQYNHAPVTRFRVAYSQSARPSAASSSAWMVSAASGSAVSAR